MSRPINKLWLGARLAALLGVCAVAMMFMSSWVLALVVGGVTIVAVAIDGWMLSRAQGDDIALDPMTDSGVDRIRIDLSRRR
jgi:hypothetical protein